MRLSTPKFLRLWVADVALRLIHLTNYGLIVQPAQSQDFLWSSYRGKSSEGTVMVRKLFSPRWKHQDVFETTATTTDGYGYKTVDFQDKK